MSNRLLVPRARRLSMPALIAPRTVLRYRGVWRGPHDFSGALLVERRAGGREWVDIADLLDGEWDGQPATAMLRVTHLVGFGVGSSRVVVPGSQTWTTTGSHLVTDFDRLEVAVWGGGAGGGGARASGAGTGTAGNQSRYVSSTPVVGGGGGGGGPGASGSPGSAGSAGTASGGDTNTSGGAPEAGNAAYGGAGGAGASGSGTLLGTLTGGANGARDTDGSGNGNVGTAPGGGGSGAFQSSVLTGGGGGGGGALAIQLWAFGDAGAPSAGDTVTVEVGATANGGSAGGGGGQSGGQGARGEVRAQWD